MVRADPARSDPCEASFPPFRPPALRPEPTLGGAHRPGARALAFLETCLARREQRRQLGELTADQLKDIGLSFADVERERRRWPWDGPAPVG
jgi:uncharacterized protein YjiS (DUF1127 family)